MFVQLEEEFLADLSHRIARAAGVDRDRVVTGFNDLLVHTLTRPKPGGFVNAVDLPGLFGPRHDAIATELIVHGVFTDAVDGYEVRGWEKRYRPMLEARAALVEGRKRGGEAAKGNLKRGKAKPQQAALPGVPAPVEPERAKSQQQLLFEEFQAMRAEHLKRLGVTVEGDEQLPPAFVNSALARFLGRCRAAKIPEVAEGEGVDVLGRFVQLVEAFLGKHYYADKSPPWPFRMFVHERGWPEIWEEVDGRRLDA